MQQRKGEQPNPILQVFFSLPIKKTKSACSREIISSLSSKQQATVNVTDQYDSKVRDLEVWPVSWHFYESSLPASIVTIPYVSLASRMCSNPTLSSPLPLKSACL